MEPVIVYYSDGRPSEVVTMPTSKKDVADVVISLVNQIKQPRVYVLFEGIPYGYPQSPELIATINTLYPMDLDKVWDMLSEDMLTILSSRFRNNGK